MISAQFVERHARAAQCEGAWRRFYHDWWPDARVIDLSGEREMQLSGGADRLVLDPSDGDLLFEEKVRFEAYDDLLVEVWSQWYGEGDPRNREGWTVDPRKDATFVAYASVPLATCRLLPAAALRAEARVRWWTWSGQYGWRDARNPDYVTRNIPVPWATVERVLARRLTPLPWGV